MFEPQDIILVGFLAFLEGILSVDNALVLAVMVRHLPPEQQKKALTYGLGGSVVFRLIALGMATYLMKWQWVKFVGGAYLLFVGLKHLLPGGSAQDQAQKKTMGFWRTVLMIELMDIAFAVDSILAAVALTQKFWIIFVGGMTGVILMRFAASLFLRLLSKFPGFEATAFMLIVVIGVKIILEGCGEVFHLEGLNFHSATHPAFWIFWGTMAACLAWGFRPKSKIRPKLKQD